MFVLFIWQKARTIVWHVAMCHERSPLITRYQPNVSSTSSILIIILIQAQYFANLRYLWNCKTLVILTVYVWSRLDCLKCDPWIQTCSVFIDSTQPVLGLLFYAPTHVHVSYLLNRHSSSHLIESFPFSCVLPPIKFPMKPCFSKGDLLCLFES